MIIDATAKPPLRSPTRGESSFRRRREGRELGEGGGTWAEREHEGLRDGRGGRAVEGGAAESAGPGSRRAPLGSRLRRGRSCSLHAF